MAAWSDYFGTATEWVNPLDPTEVYGSKVRSDLVARNVGTIRDANATFDYGGAWWRPTTVDPNTGLGYAYTTDNGWTTTRAFKRAADGSIEVGDITNSYESGGSWYWDQAAKDFYRGAAKVLVFAASMGSSGLAEAGAETGASSYGWGLDGVAGDTAATYNVGSGAASVDAGLGWGLDGAAGDTAATYNVGQAGATAAGAAGTAAGTAAGSGVTEAVGSAVLATARQLAPGVVASLVGSRQQQQADAAQANAQGTPAGAMPPILLIGLGLAALYFGMKD